MTRVGEGSHDWPRGPYRWSEGKILCISVPFTWNLPELRAQLEQGSLLWDGARVGGPAVELLPEFLKGIPGVEMGGGTPGVLQRIHPLATRSTEGCTRTCGFCGIGRGIIEHGGFRCLSDWPDLPIQCDNNLLAAPLEHFDIVIDRLIRHGWGDFNQGLDTRYLTRYHADRIARIPKPLVRLALDAPGMKEEWEHAFDLLRSAGIRKKAIRSYALIGYNTGPAEAWERCRWIERHGVAVLPMWYHPLDALQYNSVTEEQQKLGWTDEKRKDLMMFYYQHIVRANRRERRFHNPDQGILIH